MKVGSTLKTVSENKGCCCKGTLNKPATATPSAQVVGSLTVKLKVDGASCDGCVKSIERVLKGLDGVVDAKMDLSNGVVSVVGNVNLESLIDTLEKAGYPASVLD